MFELVASYKPAGDKPKAIEKLVAGIQAGKQHQTLLGVTRAILAICFSRPRTPLSWVSRESLSGP